MNYRHAYHAGGAADVFKHAVWCGLIERLQAKPTPLALIDVFAGLGRYDLQDGPAQKTLEAADGILKLLDGPPPAGPSGLTKLLALTRAENPDGGARYYPGSPALALAMLRPDDRLTVNELHPEDWTALAALVAGDKRAQALRQDAYGLLTKTLPPTPRRGAVLIDPPFERPDERKALTQALATAYRRWATGVYALWVPVKSTAELAMFEAELTQTGATKILRAAFLTRPDGGPGLIGSTMTLINPPWRFDEDLSQLLDVLAARLGVDRSLSRVDWLAGPD